MFIENRRHGRTTMQVLCGPSPQNLRNDYPSQPIARIYASASTGSNVHLPIGPFRTGWRFCHKSRVAVLQIQLTHSITLARLLSVACTWVLSWGQRNPKLTLPYLIIGSLFEQRAPSHRKRPHSPRCTPNTSGSVQILHHTLHIV